MKLYREAREGEQCIVVDYPAIVEVEAVAVRWCAEHNSEIRGTHDGRSVCAWWLYDGGWPCRLEDPPSVYRIEVSDED